MSFNAFELVPVIDRVQLMGDKPKTTVQCLDCAAQNLYVGTGDCFIIHYIVADDVSSAGKSIFQYNLQGYKQLGMKKPVQQLLTAASINRLIVLCDGVLFLLSMIGLELVLSGFKDKLKGATCIARNDNPKTFDPFSVQVCVATRKKTIHIITVTEDNVYSTREISLPEPPLHMKFDGSTVCVALSNQYCNVHVGSGKVQQLISYEPQNTKPVIARIAENEFLLSGPTDAIGMFITSDGTSLRPPLSWNDGLFTLGFSHPYIVVVGDTTITIYSILEAETSQKQVIPFQAGRLTCNSENKVFVCSAKAIFCLVQVPYKRQIQMLINIGKVEDALQLAHVAMDTEIGSSRDEMLLTRVQQQAGFVYLSEGRYQDASNMFREGNLDVRQLIALYPGFLPAGSHINAQLPGMEHVKDISQLVKDNAEALENSKVFLQEYLEECKGIDETYNLYKEEIDTALLKLYAEQNSPILGDLVCSKNACAYVDSVEWLKKYERYHNLAIYHESQGEPQASLELWKRLADGELQDSEYTGMEFLIQCLIKSNDEEVIWRYVPWVMTKDQALAVRVFTECPMQDKSGDKLQTDYILEYFSKFPIALQKYLEYVVFEQKSQNEKYHSRLAVFYLDHVQILLNTPGACEGEIKKARSDLQALLKFSTLYNASVLLSKIPEQSGLHLELAMLYGRLEHHEKALNIYVHKLQDFDGAVEHCEMYSEGRNTSYRKKLFFSLLSVYLSTKGDESDAMIMAAVALLNSHIHDFDPVEVMQHIPQEWSIGLISPFLLGLSRKSLHNSRHTKINSNLVRGENLATRQRFVHHTSKQVLITEETYCQVCRRPFNDSQVARYPNNVVTHVHCARHKQLCPVTGQLFSLTEKNKHR